MGELAENTVEELPDTEPQAQEVEEVEYVLEGDDDTPASDTVPVATHINLKKKLREAKQQNETLESAEGDLKAKNKALEQELQLLKLKAKQESSSGKPVAPSRKDFTDDYGDFDGDAYDAALKKYGEDFQAHIENTVSQKLKSGLDEIQTGKKAAAQSDALDSAIERVVKEADELKIKNFDEAATAVAGMFPEGVYQSLLTQDVIDAKTTVYLSKNPAKVDQLLNTARTRGDAAAIRELTLMGAKLKPKNFTPPPEPDEPVTGAKGAGGIDYQKLIDNERDKPAGEYDANKVIDIKQQAAAAGVTVR